jgi:hypothetical protein
VPGRKGRRPRTSTGKNARLAMWKTQAEPRFKYLE